jgi:hypothetical protein
LATARSRGAVARAARGIPAIQGLRRGRRWSMRAGGLVGRRSQPAGETRLRDPKSRAICAPRPCPAATMSSRRNSASNDQGTARTFAARPGASYLPR